MPRKITLMTIACAEALKELRRVPSGEFYARVMPHMSIHEYNIIIESLKRAKMVSESNHVLTWLGPTTSKS